MKFITLISISALLYLQACSQNNKQNDSSDIGNTSVHYISQADAEKILGQPATLTESSVEKKDHGAQYKYTFTTNDSAATHNRTAHLYCMFEAYSDEAAAKKTFADIFLSNQNMPNLKKINIGDEALQHTDNENFDLIIVRKNNKMIRLKVNKLTNLTSSEELFSTAEKLTKVL